MAFKNSALALTLVMAAGTVPAPAWAFGGIGCSDLPDYDRAQGVLQGIPSACDMSVERARAIVAAHDGPAAVAAPAAPPRAHHRHRRRVRTDRE